jgi:hypothetical protein
MALSVSNIVRVTINLAPQAAATRSFGTLMIAGDSDVINGKERFRAYSGIDGVAGDFGLEAPEYLAASLYFGQSPKPASLFIGRWLREASAALNLGGILTVAQQAMSNWTAISSGAFDIDVDGTTYNLSGLDFTGASNLNGVASIITAAFGGAAECTWNGSYFTITSGTTGAGAKATGTVTLDTNPSYGAQATGTITLSGNPSNGDTVTIKGTTVTFVSGTPSGNQVQIGATAADTSAALQTFLAASADSNLAACTYNTISLVTTVTARVYGTAGNSYSLTKSGSNISVSGSGNLAGGVAPDTLTLNGVALTFVAHGNAGASKVVVGATAAATAANLQTYLSTATTGGLIVADYSTASTVLTVTYKTTGTGGNAYTLAKSSSHISLSGATLSGGTVASSVGYADAPGSGTDISAQLKLTSATSQSLVDGYDAETPVECAAVLEDKSTAWYGLMFAASVPPTDDQNVDVAAFIEALDITRVFGVTITDTSVLSALVTNDLASRLKDLNYRQSCVQYSGDNAYAIASFMGRAFSVNFNGQNTTITLMFKKEPGVVGENLTQTQANTLRAKRCNVYVDYDNDTVILQYGTMCGDAYFDEIHGVDWLQNAIQTAVYNLLYTSLTKVPQTDAGVNLIVNTIDAVCSQGVTNGFLAPGVWNGPAFGNLNTGDYLKAGYYIFAPSVATQSQSDRDLRKAPTIQVAVKLAGAIQEVDIIVDVNR